MSILGLFLLFLFVFFIVVPVVRLTLMFFRLRSQARRFFDGMNGGSSQADGRQSGSRQSGARQRRSGGTTNPEQPRKKIDPRVGEYVEFEEIACNVTTDSATGTTTRTTTSTRIKVESQIEDAEWEDIK